jgi:membrane protein YdbS with pleckstrin-like domain
MSDMTPVSRGYLPAQTGQRPAVDADSADRLRRPRRPRATRDSGPGRAVLGVLLVWQLWLLPAQARNRRWAETTDELLITRGRLWRTFTVVPYGRIQYVDVTAGPVERLFGVKRVKLHTASSTSDSEVVGLDAATADALRDRLAVAARERMSGL